MQLSLVTHPKLNGHSHQTNSYCPLTRNKKASAEKTSTDAKPSIYAFFIFANTHTFNRENKGTKIIVTIIPLIILKGKIPATII